MAETEEERRGRHYDTSELPALKPSSGVRRDPDETAIRLSFYSESVGAWKKLTDTRFALLGLVPAVSLLAWIQLLGAAPLRTGLGPVFGFLISVAGFELVRSLQIYDRRNDELYNDVISRARRVERELGIDTGLFLGRWNPKHQGVDHSTAVDGIYRVCKVGWVLAALSFVVIALALVG